MPTPQGDPNPGLGQRVGSPGRLRDPGPAIVLMLPENKVQNDALPNEFSQLGVGGIVRALLVLAFVHGTVHAGLEERAGWLIGPGSDELVQLVFVSVEITPYKGGFLIGGHASAELHLLANEEAAFLVR